MTEDFMDLALNYQPGIRVAPSNKWVMTNGVIQMDICGTCAQPYREGHIDCTCPSNHPENCDRPTYEELASVGEHDAYDPSTTTERFERQRRIAGDNIAQAQVESVPRGVEYNGAGEQVSPTTAPPEEAASPPAMDFALKYRNMLESLLKRHNGEGESMMLTILSPTDIEEIEEVLAWRKH